MLIAPGAFHHLAAHRGGGGLFGFLVHAAIWHVVGRVLYQLPVAVDVAAVSVLVVVYLLLRRRRVPASSTTI